MPMPQLAANAGAQVWPQVGNVHVWASHCVWPAQVGPAQVPRQV
ncbi:MAG TPA: hypothetical protein VJA16_07660 [Thermoanaerobaculia bacterium]